MEKPAMIAELTSRVILRDLSTLRDQVLAYDNEADLWKTTPGITNSAGTLALHLAGNLQHYVGAVLGRSGYVRNREAEFSSRDVARETIVEGIDAAMEAVRRALGAVDNATLDGDFPVDVLGVRVTTAQFLVHLATHLAFHLGQVDYHRRIITGAGSLPDAQSIRVLAQ